MSIWTALAAGLAAGGLHVLAGPDHLAAIGALSSGHARPGALGFRWGSGHALGVLLVGLAAIALRSFADLAPLERWGEALVGVSLVVAGIRALAAWKRPAPASPRWAAAFGALHGVAGGSHLWGTLPALALPANGPAQAYLAAFCAASIVVMTAFAAALGWTGGSRQKHWALAAGAASILIGIGWAAYSFA
ncbi:MAG TPA: High-affinity nickel transporter [Planctomycetota bacterium]